MTSNGLHDIHLSILAPAHNEEDNVAPLVSEVRRAITPLGRPFEMILIDDGSTDSTRRRALSLRAEFPFLRVLAMQQTPPGRGHGQSAAFRAGILASRGRLIAMLDADLQNDPADLPALIAALEANGADMVQGDRSANRRDHVGRRAASWVGRTFRRMILDDAIRDTGCSLRVLRREVALAIPLEYRGLHRFIPVTARQCGFTVIEVPVTHRPRAAGTAKYGTFNRAIPGLVDCFGVRWMRTRRRPVLATEIDADESDGSRP